MIKRRKDLLEISKKQAKELNNMGVPFGNNGISKTVHGRHYYLCENRKNIVLLSKVTHEKA